MSEAPSIGNESKVCPYCAEQIKKEAVVCRYCGNSLAKHGSRPHVGHRRAFLAGLTVMAICILAAFYFSPYYAAHRLQLALQHNDIEELNDLVDFAVVREGLKSNYLSSQRDELAKNSSDPFALFGTAMGVVAVNGMIDTFVSPAGLNALFQGNSVESVAQKSAATGQGTPETAVNKKSKQPFKCTYESLNRFRIEPGNWSEPGSQAAFVLSRHNLFFWKVTRLEFECAPQSVDGPYVTDLASDVHIASDGGLRIGDQIKSINDVPVHSYDQAIAMIHLRALKNTKFEFVRQHSPMTSYLTPNDHGRIGVDLSGDFKAVVVSSDHSGVPIFDSIKLMKNAHNKKVMDSSVASDHVVLLKPGSLVNVLTEYSLPIIVKGRKAVAKCVKVQLAHADIETTRSRKFKDALWFIVGDNLRPANVTSNKDPISPVNITEELLDKLQGRCSYEQVSNTLGSSGIKRSSFSDGTTNVALYRWTNKDGSWITLCFRDGILEPGGKGFLLPYK